jgi:hypothetical protein
VNAAQITGTMTAIDHKTGKVEAAADTFSYTAEPLHLPAGATVNL